MCCGSVCIWGTLSKSPQKWVGASSQKASWSLSSSLNYGESWKDCRQKRTIIRFLIWKDLEIEKYSEAEGERLIRLLWRLSLKGWEPGQGQWGQVWGGVWWLETEKKEEGGRIMDEVNSIVVELSLGSHVSGGSYMLTRAKYLEQHCAQGKHC